MNDANLNIASVFIEVGHAEASLHALKALNGGAVDPAMTAQIDRWQETVKTFTDQKGELSIHKGTLQELYNRTQQIKIYCEEALTTKMQAAFTTPHNN